MSRAFDAVLVLSFGGPEGPDDVLAFLRNVTRGRGVPDERLAAVAEQYNVFGGRSPINDQCRALIAALRDELDQHGSSLPIYWGNRNWHPYISDTVEQMAADGVRRALVFVTSAFGSYSGCRQYREDLEQARSTATNDPPELVKLRLFHNHPGFLYPVADRVRTALDSRGSVEPDKHRLLFTAHSLPRSMAAGCDYETQLLAAAGEVARLTGSALAMPWELAFQSRSGPPQVPWLEPDVGDRIEQLANDGVGCVTLVPLGFISDHMEVIYDLDTLAAGRAERAGVHLVRASTVGTDPRFVTMIRELIEERTLGRSPVAIGSLGPWPNECPPNHCPPPTGLPSASPH